MIMLMNYVALDVYIASCFMRVMMPNGGVRVWLSADATTNTDNINYFADRLFSSWRENCVVFYVSADATGGVRV